MDTDEERIRLRNQERQIEDERRDAESRATNRFMTVLTSAVLGPGILYLIALFLDGIGLSKGKPYAVRWLEEPFFVVGSIILIGWFLKKVEDTRL